ncbi:MBL fold metallo-hydrolase [Agaribacter marinus]|uniref:MBL fold metallo-hydrolase n=1 Tax=Virgibacillus salarius TaxID=447199 RepID=A0A941DYP0_9BACI|nr:MBL fold metallo-hydrolase [Virgibacillus salarius]MBR7797801.1 MBL fold metallo-hydrolase [Virgibacillus salarius]NAZ10511.1 MBL fold metallo-hydrolase [Agaribacter marinus]
MDIERMSLGPLGTNCYLVHDNQQALIIDPGGESAKIIHFLSEKNIEPLAILLTHGHFDHIGAVDDLRKYYKVEVYIHKLEASWLEDPQANGSLYFMQRGILTSRPDRLLHPGKMAIGNFHFDVIHTPGHSPGSVTFIFSNAKFIVSGDVLFNEGIGRTDLPGGDMKQLEDSIINQLYRLDESLVVYPGHGPKTSLIHEKKHNPFFSI